MAAPRKRATAAPRRKPEAKPEGLDVAEEAPEEANDADDAEETPTDTTEPAPPAEPKPAKSDPPSAEQPCADCFTAGWPDDATSAGCAHGTWNRDL